MSTLRNRLKRGDSITVEKVDDYSVSGRFVAMDEEFIVVKSTVGNNIGQEVFIPMRNVAQIVVSKRRSDDE